MDDNAEEWLATEDPTEGDLPTTEFIGSAKDLSQNVEPEETDGTEIPEVPEVPESGTSEDSDDENSNLGAPEEPEGILALSEEESAE